MSGVFKLRNYDSEAILKAILQTKDAAIPRTSNTACWRAASQQTRYLPTHSSGAGILYKRAAWQLPDESRRNRPSKDPSQLTWCLGYPDQSSQWVLKCSLTPNATRPRALSNHVLPSFATVPLTNPPNPEQLCIVLCWSFPLRRVL